MDKSITVEKFWNSVKWSNQNPNGSISISAERVKGIDDVVNKEAQHDAEICKD